MAHSHGQRHGDRGCGLTEPGAGSDAGATKTAAVPEGDHWVINGSKQFITNIGLDNASIMIIAARTKDVTGRDAVNAFIVPKGTPGFKLGRKYDKMGWTHSATHECIFEDCCIPRDHFLGKVGRGLAQHLAVLETGRISIAAMSVGLARACCEASLKYAKGPVQFGKPIFAFQAVSLRSPTWPCTSNWPGTCTSRRPG